MINYTLTKIIPGVFHVKCKSPYDLAMLFVRAQEYYECPNPEIKGQYFKMNDFIEWYSAKNDMNEFTYPVDWCGFNIPDYAVRQAIDGAFKIGDSNEYDHTMLEIIKSCELSNMKFYLVGTMEVEFRKINIRSTIAHELAHALYYLDSEYRQTMLELNLKIKEQLTPNLLNYGYHEEVVDDEIQAYMISGLSQLILDQENELYNYAINYQNVFQLKLEGLLKTA